MDPITITTTVIHASAACLTTAKKLYEIRSQYKDAPMHIVSICSETTVISASLSRIQSLLLREPDLPNLLGSRPELIAALDASLTGCMVLFSCLEDEMDRIQASSSQSGTFSWRGKARLLWNRDKLKDLLEGLRGLQVSLNLLIQLLQVDSLAEIKKLVEEGRPALANTLQRTESLRSSHPKIQVPESIYSNDDQGSIIESMNPEYCQSIWSDRSFDFDDLIVSSRVYRRALAAAKAGQQSADQTGKSTDEDVVEGDLIDFSDAATITQEVQGESSRTGALADIQSLIFSELRPLDKENETVTLKKGEQKPTQLIDRTVSSNTPAASGSETPSDITPSRPKSSIATQYHENDTTEARQGLVRRKPLNITPAATDKEPGGNTPTDQTNSREQTNRSDDTSSSTEVSSTSVDSNASIKSSPAANGSRICGKCEEPLTGQFVRALGKTYHLNCFTCKDCGQVVASKFFPVTDDSQDQYPLCEYDYFRRLDLICFHCNASLRGTYITALNRKYHTEHFQCSAPSCNVVFGAKDSYYEHDDAIFCWYHYSLYHATRCSGCQEAVLKQFVEIFRTGQNQTWHPECYMIHKFWNVKVAADQAAISDDLRTAEADQTIWKSLEKQMEEREGLVSQIWHVLSKYEEYIAVMISDFLLNVSNGNFLPVIPLAAEFIEAVSAYGGCLSKVNSALKTKNMQSLTYSRELKLLCKKLVALFSLMANHSDGKARKMGVTQELLSLVTGLAHYMKLMIRTGLQGALKADAVEAYLQAIPEKTKAKQSVNDEYAKKLPGLADNSSDRCDLCSKPIEEACYMVAKQRYHAACLACPHCKIKGAYPIPSDAFSQNHQSLVCRHCSQPVESSITFVSTYQQYMYLLHVALARLAVECKIDWGQAIEAAKESLNNNREDGSAWTESIKDTRELRDIPSTNSSSPTESLTLDDIPRLVAMEQSRA